MHLKGLLVDVCVIPNVRLPCFAEEYELLKQEDVAEAFLLSERHHELILPYQLTLLLQIDLQGTMEDLICTVQHVDMCSMCMCVNIYLLGFTDNIKINCIY